MKKLIAILLLCLSTQAFATKVGDVNLDEQVRVASSDLQLNGAGIRKKMVFKVYVAALYLGEKKNTAEAVLKDTGVKRVELHMLRRVDASEFMDAFITAIKANHTPAEFVPIMGRLIRFAHTFSIVGEVNKGDVITIDYLPNADNKNGVTVVKINDKERDKIVGADFYLAMLKIWLGDKPVQDSLKKEMLGDAS